MDPSNYWEPLNRSQREDPPVPTGILNHYVVIFINATYCARGGEGLKHAVGPPPVAMLEGLDYLEV